MAYKRSSTTPPTTALSSKSTITNNGSFTYGQCKTHNNINTSIQNWQLRNLISFADNHTILHPYHESLCFYNPALGTETSLPLPFAPTTIDSRCGYVAVGGHRGMAMVKSISNDVEWSSTLKVGMGMNNCIQLSGHSNNECRLTICNNDQTMSVYSIPDLRNLMTLDLSSAAINQISTSPDGRALLTVSDDGYVSLFNTRDYTKTTSFQVSDGGPVLACAWNDDNNMIAVGSHEGTVHVYDVRQSHHALAKIGSTEARSTRNAPRSIRFSHSPLDLLVYAEHVSNINIVDTRTFETRQVVRLGPDDCDTHIAGIDLSPDNRSIYAGLETDMVQIDIDTAVRRQFPSARLF